MKTKVLVDVKIECEPPHIPYWQARNAEERSKVLDEWCRDFNEFIRDHRSQDRVRLDAVKVFQDQCSLCHREWDEDNQTGEPQCCSKAIEEWEASRVAANT